MKKYGSLAFGVLVGAVSVYMLATSNTARHIDSFVIQWADANTITRPQMKNVQATSVVDSIAYITGVGVDTTCAFEIYPYMSAFVALNDTSSDDSTQSVIKLYVSVNNQYRRSRLPLFSEYRLAKTWTASGDTVINITNSPIPIAQTGYFEITGGADNKTQSAVENKITLSGL